MLGHTRLLLAFGVLLAHTKLLPDETSRSMVSGFFLASGYLMMLTLRVNYGTSVAPFYWNRILRLYPLHITISVAMLIAFRSYSKLRAIEFADGGTPQRAIDVTLSLLLVPGYAGFLNRPAWTLPFELVYYAIAPLVFRAGWVGIAIYMAVAVGGYAWLADPAYLLNPFGLTPGAPGHARFFSSSFYFATGALIFKLKDAGIVALAPQVRGLLQPAGLAGLGLVLVLTCIFLPERWRDAVTLSNGVAVNIAAVGAVATVLLAWDGVESSVSKLAGDLCYPVYMIHAVFSEQMRDIGWYRGLLDRVVDALGFLPQPEFVARSLVTTAFTLALGLCWIAIERRTFRRLKRRART